MKTSKAHFLFFLILIASLIAGISGCSHKTDACATTQCLNGGTCANGQCSCPPHFVGQYCDSCMTGYEGSDCMTYVRAKFLYSGYSVSERLGTGSSYTYSSTILASNTQTDQVYLVKVGNGAFLNTVSAICSRNTITIPRQKPDINYTFIEGSGSISGGVVTLNYQIQDSPSVVIKYYTSTWSR